MKDDAISRQAVLEGLASIAKAKARSDAQKSMMGRTMFFVEQLPSVSTENPNRSEIKQKCDRINSLASVLPYAPHREIQELLCDIMDLCKAESEDERNEQNINNNIRQIKRGYTRNVRCRK